MSLPEIKKPMALGLVERKRTVVLEMGNYISVAYAGMLLAEQGYDVYKVIHPTKKDPILQLRHGKELWDWINHGKKFIIAELPNGLPFLTAVKPDIVIENVRQATWQGRWCNIMAELCLHFDPRWVGLRDELGDKSFDVIAQARAFLNFSPRAAFYLGDTAAGLWMAFKASCSNEGGMFMLHQASILHKLVEGEMVVKANRTRGHLPSTKTFWDKEIFGANDRVAFAEYKGEIISEPIRDHKWRWANLKHDGKGRIII
jgi:hypothetical protein